VRRFSFLFLRRFSFLFLLRALGADSFRSRFKLHDVIGYGTFGLTLHVKDGDSESRDDAVVVKCIMWAPCPG
jgi:hypothetical protein